MENFPLVFEKTVNDGVDIIPRHLFILTANGVKFYQQNSIFSAFSQGMAVLWLNKNINIPTDGVWFGEHPHPTIRVCWSAHWIIWWISSKIVGKSLKIHQMTSKNRGVLYPHITISPHNFEAWLYPVIWRNEHVGQKSKKDSWQRWPKIAFRPNFPDQSISRISITKLQPEYILIRFDLSHHPAQTSPQTLRSFCPQRLSTTVFPL